jgi:DNA-nicking Smr family endonuclease
MKNRNKEPSRPATKGRSASTRAVGRDEADLFALAMREVKPLRQEGAKRAAPDGAAPVARAETAAGAIRAVRSLERGPIRTTDKLPELKTGASPGLDKRMAARLKRGQLAIEGRIDLHGMTQDKAHRALEAFLGASQGAGKRCVLVITGKGLRPTGETGVLRNLVPRWMNAPAIRGRVLSFCTAQPRDGGTGALYVLLKRKR